MTNNDRELLNPIAEQDLPDSGNIVTPSEAYLLKGKHDFYCPDFDCRDKERILYVKPSKNKVYFFYHRKGCDHEIRGETLLHKLAIKWFEDKEQIELPGHSAKEKRFSTTVIQLDPRKTYLEYSRIKLFVPDVKLCSINGFDFAIEIVVTNDVNDNKKKLIQQFNLPTLRIDLSGFYNRNKEACRVNKEFIEQHLNKLLTDIQLKKWVVAPDIELLSPDFHVEAIPQGVSNSQSGNSGCMIILPLAGLIWLLNKLTSG